MKITIKETPSGYETLNSSRKVFQSFREISKADQETFWIVGVNAKNREILRECLFMGGITTAHVDPKILFRRVLMAGCVAFVVVHNHPSGDPMPSPEDRYMTEKIKEGSEILSLSFNDHVIIGDDEKYYSFRDAGYLGP